MGGNPPDALRVPYFLRNLGVSFCIKNTLKTTLSSAFFTSGPVVLSNATPDLHDTTYPGQAPHAQYTRPGQACLPCTVQEIWNYFPIFEQGPAGFVLTSVIQNGSSWRGPQKHFPDGV